jgi:oligoribonuclease (3'-5' exoribonuclease)
MSKLIPDLTWVDIVKQGGKREEKSVPSYRILKRHEKLEDIQHQSDNSEQAPDPEGFRTHERSKKEQEEEEEDKDEEDVVTFQPRRRRTRLSDFYRKKSRIFQPALGENQMNNDEASDPLGRYETQDTEPNASPSPFHLPVDQIDPQRRSGQTHRMIYEPEGELPPNEVPPKYLIPCYPRISSRSPPYVIGEDKRETILVLADLEMTGLSLAGKSLEIALILVNSELEEMGMYTAVFHVEDHILSNTLEKWSKDTHSQNGLLREVKDSLKTAPQIDQEIVQFITSIFGSSASLKSTYNFIPTGSSIQNDLRFIEKELPFFYDLLNYRIIELGTIMKLTQLWRPKDYQEQPEMRQPIHRSLPDAYSALNLLRYYRNRLFTPTTSMPTTTTSMTTSASEPQLQPGTRIYNSRSSFQPSSMINPSTTAVSAGPPSYPYFCVPSPAHPTEKWIEYEPSSDPSSSVPQYWSYASPAPHPLFPYYSNSFPQPYVQHQSTVPSTSTNSSSGWHSGFFV